ncbi:MAG: hypothetical protein CMF25_07480 [Kangiellaceae bacterium]|nr:hypothetical protein [Kangiellaceae bacterium]|tara:strand:+ start:4160 stop:5455 length:1296 start_codon:yes stop_codon:yes gene_type:complete
MASYQSPSVVPHILFGMFVLEILFLFIKKIDGTLYGVFDTFEKLYPIIAIVLLTSFMRPKLNRYWWAALLFYSAYLVYGVLISLANQKSMHIILVQTYHEMKFFPMLFLYSTVRCDNRWSKTTLKLIKPLIIITVLLIIFQLGAPGPYDAIFKNGGHFEKGHIGGMLLPRAVGWFWHPGQIALFFLITAVFTIVEYKKRTIRFGVSMLLLCILFVVLPIQRFELFILFNVLLLLWMRRYLGFNYKPLLACIVLCSFGGGFLYIISDEALFWVLLEDFQSPRNVFLVESLFTLVESNYWGAGWGTIGSHAAADVAKVYEYNAMKDIWWVKLGQYFYDTYWPHVIGETGIPGFFLLLLSMVFMIMALEQPQSSILLFVLILTSALSSNAQSLYHLCVFGWFILLLENAHNQPVAISRRNSSAIPSTNLVGVRA